MQVHSPSSSPTLTPFKVSGCPHMAPYDLGSLGSIPKGQMTQEAYVQSDYVTYSFYETVCYILH